MKKKINIPFSLFVFTALIFVSCNSKKSIDTIPEKSEIAETISTSEAIKEENENIEKTNIGLESSMQRRTMIRFH